LWLGWENYIVFRRRTIAERLVDERRGHHTEYAADGAGTFRGPGGSNLFTWKGDSSVTARSLQFMLGSSNVFVPRSTGPSWLRSQLGDLRYASFLLNEKADIQEIRRWFPEAIVVLKPSEVKKSPSTVEIVSRKSKTPERSILVHKDVVSTRDVTETPGY
jgi:hypothetical protein